MLRKFTNRQKGFTLIELLIVIAIIGIIAALLIPNFLDALQKGKQKRTMGDMKDMGTAMFSWVTDQAGAAAAGANTVTISDYTTQTASSVAGVLVTQYIQDIPSLDGWRHLYDYYLDTADPMGSFTMLIRSKGRDGVEDGATYTPGGFEPTDYDKDLVWADGFFVRYPQKTTAL